MRRVFGTVAIACALVIAAGCSEHPTTPTAAPVPAQSWPQRIELVDGQPVTVPGTSLRLTVRLAPLWLYPVCPADAQVLPCGPEGPGVYLDAQAPGRAGAFDLMPRTRPSHTFDRYDVRLESISPEPPLSARPAASGYTVRLLVSPAIAVP